MKTALKRLTKCETVNSGLRLTARLPHGSGLPFGDVLSLIDRKLEALTREPLTTRMVEEILNITSRERVRTSACPMWARYRSSAAEIGPSCSAIRLRRLPNWPTLRTGSTNGGESMQHRLPVPFMAPLQIRHPILLMSGWRPIDSDPRITPHVDVTVLPNRKIWGLRGKPVYCALREIPALPPQL